MCTGIINGIYVGEQSCPSPAYERVEKSLFNMYSCQLVIKWEHFIFPEKGVDIYTLLGI